jgi:uncharacterized protein YggE
MKSLMRAAALAALISTSALAAAAQTTAPPVTAQIVPPVLNLSAFGEVRTAPDMATISLGVTTQGATADEAMRTNATRMNQVVAALKGRGVAERDIQTSGLNLNPQYAYNQGEAPRLTGYQAMNQVTIRVMDLARLGPMLDAVVGAGANQVQGISFGLKNPQAAEDDARRRAVQALQAKATLYASATGMRLARLVSLSEGGGYQPQPPRPVPMMAEARMKGADTSVSPGELLVRIDIDGIYELR